MSLLEHLLSLDNSKDSLHKTFTYLSKVAERKEDDRECYRFFHKLIYKIFGFDNNYPNTSNGWLIESEYDEIIYDLIIKLLEPEGPLFKIMFMNNDFLFYKSFSFRIDKLSYGMQWIYTQLITTNNNYSNNTNYSNTNNNNEDSFQQQSQFTIPDTLRYQMIYFREKFFSLDSLQSSFSDFNAMRGGIGGRNGNSILLSMFEYYLFCFFYFLESHPRISFKSMNNSEKESSFSTSGEFFNIQSILSKLSPMRPEASRKSKKVPVLNYLFSKYLNFFFPLNNNSSITSSNNSNNNGGMTIDANNTLLLSNNGNNNLKNFTKITIKEMTSHASEISSTFLYILCDYLFNQLRESTFTNINLNINNNLNMASNLLHDETKYIFSNNFTRNATKIIYFETMATKHLLRQQVIVDSFFSNNNNKFNIDHLEVKRMIENGNELPYSLLILQNSIYRFLKGIFTSWPNNQQFPLQYIISLWKSYLFPWNLKKSTLQNSLQNSLQQQSTGNNNEKQWWPNYIIVNWCFYSSLFILFLKFILNNINLNSRTISDIDSLLQLLQEFSQPHMIDLFIMIDQYILQKREFISLQQKGGNYNLLNHIVMCEESLQNYESLYSRNTLEIVKGIIYQAQLVKQQQNSSSSKIFRIFAKKSNLSSSINNNTSNGDKYAIDLSKRMQHLISLLEKIFNISQGILSTRDASLSTTTIDNNNGGMETASNYLLLSSPFDPQAGGRVLPSPIYQQQQQQYTPNMMTLDNYQSPDTIPATIVDYDHHLTSPSLRNYDIDYNNNNNNNREYFGRVLTHQQQMRMLSPVGRLQIMEGKRKCSKMDVEYIGDSLYKPIQTNEFEWLVEKMILLTEWFERKYHYRFNFRIFANISNLLFLLFTIFVFILILMILI